MNAPVRTTPGGLMSLMTATQPIPVFRQCIDKPAILVPPAGDRSQIECATGAFSALIRFTHEIGVMPEIEMLTICVSAQAFGVMVRVDLNEVPDEHLTAHLLSIQLAACLEALAALLKERPELMTNTQN